MIWTHTRQQGAARTVSIIVDVHHTHPAHIRLIIEDDGHGFDAEAALHVGVAHVGTTLFVRIPV